MNMLFRVSLFIAVSVVAVLPSSNGQDTAEQPVKAALRGAMIDAVDVSEDRLQELKDLGFNTIVLPLSNSDKSSKEAINAAIKSVRQEELSLAYWVEVARSPELADQHPEWMASLQTHDEWRRFFPNTAKPKANEVTKTYPWVPILSRAPFAAQRKRVRDLLSAFPAADRIFLNDLQGAPSACGCGSPLCRWTSDYGKRRNTIPLGDEAAALFVSYIQEAAPNSEVIPVWTTECEEHDGSADGLCAGVGCFTGICWKAYTRQLMPLSKVSKRVAVLALYKEFQRDLPIYGPDEASWIEFAVKSFTTMPPRNNGAAIRASRVITILQGWDVTDEEIEAQQNATEKAGANGFIVAYTKIEQSWSPKIVPWK